MSAGRILGIVWLVALGSAAQADAPSLSGPWLFGDYRPEPKEPVVSIPQRCWSGGVDFALKENESRLTGNARWIAATQGVPPSVEREETESLSGRRDGNHVILLGQHKVVELRMAYPSVAGGAPATTVTKIKYDLKIDPRTGHLVGTRDGQPFWLARFKVHPAPCGSPPP
ncbi:MAG TPA: hypothetical protein VMT03_02670 [Polyangia bacterium]|nr:hypothetical protein [Polyangia bacterium]